MTRQVINTPVVGTTGGYLSPPNGGERTAHAHADRGRAPAGAREYHRPAAESTPEPRLCHLCAVLLDPVLIRAGYATHPCCDPGERMPGQRSGDVTSLPGAGRGIRKSGPRRLIFRQPLSPQNTIGRDQ